MKKNIFGRNDVEARASVRTPSYAPVYILIRLEEVLTFSELDILNLQCVGSMYLKLK